MSRQKPPPIPLTADHVARMERDAAAALARRDGGFYVEHVMLGVEAALLALCSLAGLWLWVAAPMEMLVVLLASVWFAIVGDAAKLWWLREPVRREAASAAADVVVWNIAEAMMRGERTVPAHALDVGHFDPRHRVLADVLIGGICTALLLLVVSQPQHGFASPLALSPAALALLAVLLALQSGRIAWVVWRHRAGRGELAPPRFAAGLRGLLLLLLVFFALLLADGGDLRPGLTLFHGGLLLLALVWLLLVGPMRREAAWLAAHLATRRESREPT